MPWEASDAEGHTSHADTDKKKRQWAAVANSALKGGASEGSAIRQANAAVHPTAKREMAEAVIKYLQDNAPEIAALVLKERGEVDKQLTAGDAHVTTALGNEDKKKKISVAYEQDDEETKTEKNDVEWSLPLKIMKADSEQQMVFGWASVATKDGKIVVDKQGDMILPEDLEKAAYDFVLYCRSQGDMHKAMQCGRLVESMMFTKEKQQALGIDLGIEGWWTGFKVDDPNLWEAHKRGERPEFSIGGRGRRIDIG